MIDTVPAPVLEALERAHYPRPIHVRTDPRIPNTLHLHFGSGHPDRWVRAVPTRPNADPWRALAACRLLVSTDVPAPRELELIASDLLVTPVPSGTPALSRLRERPLEVARAVGACLRTLWSAPVESVTFGATSDGLGLYPDAADWAEHCALRARRALVCARARGQPVGPASHALLDRVLRADLHLGSFHLVHGALAPEALWLDQEGQPSAWLHWEHALLGDPLLDWVPALFIDRPALRELIRALPEPASFERLDAYAALFVLESLAEPDRSDAHRARACAWATAIAEGRFAERRWEEANQGTYAVRMAVEGPEAFGLRSLNSDPLPVGARTPAILGSLAAAMLHRTTGEQPFARQARLLAGQGTPRPVELSDRAGALRQVRARVAERLPEERPVDLVLPLVWLALEAAGSEGALTDAALQGLCGVVEANRVADARRDGAALEGKERAARSLVFAVLSMAAVHRLPVWLDLDPSEVGAARQRLLRRATRDAELLGLAALLMDGSDGVVGPAVAQIAARGDYAPHEGVLPAVVYAFSVLERAGVEPFAPPDAVVAML